MPMQPRPNADTVIPLFPILRFCMLRLSSKMFAAFARPVGLAVARPVIVALVIPVFGLLFFFYFQNSVLCIALPHAWLAVIAAAALLPVIGRPTVANALHDRATPNPDVAVAVPRPVARCPDVTGCQGGRGLIEWRRRRDADAVSYTHL